MEVVEENGSYTFKVKIPRGYQATVEVVDSDGAQVALKGSDLSLGRMMSYYKKAEDPNRILLKEDSPSSMILNGTYEAGPVTKDQTVRVKYRKVDTFTFSAADWKGTGVLQIRMLTESGDRCRNPGPGHFKVGIPLSGRFRDFLPAVIPTRWISWSLTGRPSRFRWSHWRTRRK